MGVRDRDNPEDLSADIFQEYRELIRDSDSDEMFYSAVYSTLFRLGTYGHLWVVEPDAYQSYCQSYAAVPEREHWREVLTDPVTVQGYERLQALLDAMGGSGLLRQIFRIDFTDKVGDGDNTVCQFHLRSIFNTGTQADYFVIRFHQIGDFLYFRILLHQFQ